LKGKLQSPNFEPRFANFGFRVSNFDNPFSIFQFPVSIFELRFSASRDSIFHFPVSIFQFRFSNFVLRISFFRNFHAGFVKLYTLVPIGLVSSETVP